MGTNNHDVHIPHELIINILSRLPSESLLRLRCVCRSWHSLITHDHDFRNFNSNKTLRHWISVRLDSSTTYSYGLKQRCLHFLHRVFDETFSSKLDECRTAFMYSANQGLTGYSRCHSINGLVCIDHYTDLILCNPSTRTLKRVEFPIYPPYGYRSFNLFGFGFANNDSDHKVIIIKFMKNDYEERHSKYTAYVHVYSLKTNSWHNIRSKPDAAWYDCIRNGTYFNGACHWMGAISSKRKILCYDFDDDKFRCMDLPSDSCAHSYHGSQLFVYKDMLALWDHCQRYKCNKLEHRFWVMKEYGSSKSWAILFLRVVPTDDSVYYFNPLYIYGSTTNGRLLYARDQDGESLMAYDIQTKQVEELVTSNVVDLVPYEDSLFLLG